MYPAEDAGLILPCPISPLAVAHLCTACSLQYVLPTDSPHLKQSLLKLVRGPQGGLRHCVALAATVCIGYLAARLIGHPVPHFLARLP